MFFPSWGHFWKVTVQFGETYKLIGETYKNHLGIFFCCTFFTILLLPGAQIPVPWPRWQLGPSHPVLIRANWGWLARAGTAEGWLAVGGWL